jgi:hypothetical protein
MILGEPPSSSALSSRAIAPHSDAVDSRGGATGLKLVDEIRRMPCCRSTRLAVATAPMV